MADQPTYPYQDKLKEHDFDGIQEYDNNLPRWWLALFAITVVWALWYIPYYHGGGGKVGPDRLREDLAELKAERVKIAAAKGVLDETALRAIVDDKARVAAGKEIYGQMCSACHGPEGLGLVGPNLRDDKWIFGSNMTDMIGVLEKGGREGKGMVSFSALGSEKLQNVAAFIADMNRQGRKDNPAKPAAADEKSQPLNW